MTESYYYRKVKHPVFNIFYTAEWHKTFVRFENGDEFPIEGHTWEFIELPPKSKIKKVKPSWLV